MTMNNIIGGGALSLTACAVPYISWEPAGDSKRQGATTRLRSSQVGCRGWKRHQGIRNLAIHRLFGEEVIGAITDVSRLV